jgi:hypothetical protein
MCDISCVANISGDKRRRWKTDHTKKEFPMSEYSVQSGPLKITIVAETAYDAALEAVRWWGRRARQNHRRALDEILAVRERGQRISESFPTFNLLAEAEGEPAETAWDRLIDLTIANNN